MTDEPRLDSPWLVAAWPGMGAVGLVAATYLARTLEAGHLLELPAGEHFDLQSVRVEEGVLQPGRLPRSLLYAWKDPEGRRDLLIFLGEAQPSARGYAFCEELLREAQERGVERVVTFAALASPLQPSDPSRVFAAASEPELLEEVRRRDEEVEPLNEGEIGGLNGVLLAAAAERGLPGACLLGEFPYFASGVPNPKASAAVLRAFAAFAGIAPDLAELEAQAEQEEDRLSQLFQRMQESRSEEEPGFTTPSFHVAEDEGEGDESGPEEPREVPADLAVRIEELFEQAERDRDRAFELKALLDRHGLFKSYEDRFLDLFKRAE